MKRTLLLLTSVTLFMVSCKKDDDVAQEPAATAITKEDMATDNKPGAATYNTFEVNLTNTPVSIPARGDKQTWDVTGLSETFVTPSQPAISVSNASFPTATYGRSGMEYFSAGGGTASTPSVYYRELSDAGVYNLGYSIQACTLNAASIGGTLTYPAQAIPFTGTTKLPILKFPAKYGDSTYTTNLLLTLNFTANAPALGVNNLPAQRTEKSTVTNSIMASGTIKLKDLGSFPVIVQKQVVTVVYNYFLGGAPAPAALLGAIGLTDGESTTTIKYDFYAKGLGYCGSIYVAENGVVYNAMFRKK